MKHNSIAMPSKMVLKLATSGVQTMASTMPNTVAMRPTWMVSRSEAWGRTRR